MQCLIHVALRHRNDMPTFDTMAWIDLPVCHYFFFGFFKKLTQGTHPGYYPPHATAHPRRRMWAASHNVDGGKKVRKRPPPIGMVSVRPGSKEPPVPQQQTQVQLLEEKSGAPEDEAAPPAPAVGPVVGSSIAEWLDGIKPGFSRFAEAFSSSGYEDAAMLFVVRLPYRNTRTHPPRMHARTDTARHPHVHAFPECRFSLLFFPRCLARLIRCRICAAGLIADTMLSCTNPHTRARVLSHAGGTVSRYDAVQRRTRSEAGNMRGRLVDCLRHPSTSCVRVRLCARARFVFAM